MPLALDKGYTKRGPKQTKERTIKRTGGSKEGYFTNKPTKDKNRPFRKSKSPDARGGTGFTASNALKGNIMLKKKQAKEAAKKKKIKSAGKGAGTTKPRFTEKDILGLGKLLNRMLKKNKIST